jgi:hypothetical protein
MNRRWAALCAAVVTLGLAFDACAQQTQQPPNSVRPEVGRPLQAAQALVKQRKGKEAMAEVAKAEAIPNLSAYEKQIIAQMKAAASSASGDNDATIRNNEALLAGKSGRDAVPLIQGIAVAYYNKKEYAEAAKWGQRYFKEGGNDASMRSLLLQSYYLGNDCNSVSKMLGNVTEDTSRKPSEEDLQILANCFLKQKDNAGYVAAIEKLVVYYPKASYWTDLLARVQKKPGFSDRLALHVFRLRMETGNLTTADDYLEMAQLALQAGLPAEAKMVVDKGYDRKVLGTGQQADRHQRLRDLVNKTLAESTKNRSKEEQEAIAAKEGNDLVKIGLNYVFEGQGRQGHQPHGARHQEGRPQAPRRRQARARVCPGPRGPEGAGRADAEDGAG